MALTLIEAAKRTDDLVRQAIIELYASSSEVLRVLPFEDIQGNALRYNREETLPGIGFRGINEGYTESTGILNPVTETLTIAGGDLDVDKFIIDTMGMDQRSVQEAMKVKALALNWTLQFIKGDSTTNPRVFDGLQARITGNQLIAAGGTANGDALSLMKLDELIDQVQNPTHLIMNKTMRRLLTQAARDTSIGGFITTGKDEFGRQLYFYADLPILIVENDNTDLQILNFNEACPAGGTATGTSIYCVSFAEGMLTGIQNGGIDARDLGELEAKPAYRSRVEWYAGLSCYHGRAAARIWGVKNAAIVK